MPEGINPSQLDTDDEGIDQDITKALGALAKERELRKTAERKVKETEDFYELKGRFPILERDDLEGLGREKWEQRAERLAGLAKRDDVKIEAKVEHETFAKADALDADTGAGEPKPMTRDEALELLNTGRITLAEMNQRIAEGKIDLPNLRAHAQRYGA